jgi:hypothetical protein
VNGQRVFAAILGFALGAATLVFGASGQPGYPGQTGYVGTGYAPDAQTLAAPNIRVVSTPADTLTTSAVLALPEFKVMGRQTLILHGRFSASGATTSVQIVYVYKKGDPDGSATSTTTNIIKEWSQIVTLTAGTTQKEGAYYESAPVYFDSNGAVTARVVMTTAVSSGTCTLVLGSE